jgi:hypothetical protein
VGLGLGLCLDRGGGTPPPQAPREDYITPTISASLNPDSKRSSAVMDSKFFYASEARSPPAPTPPTRPASLLLPKTSSSSSFLQGGRPDNRAAQNESVTSNPTDSASKFFYANGVPDLPTPTTTSPASSGSFGRPGVGQAPHARPNSPTKHLAQMQGLRPPAPLSSSRSQVGALGASLVAKRRVSAEAVPRQGIHSRSGSAESTVATRITSPTPPRWPSGPSTPASPGVGQFQPAMTMASILQVAEELSEEEDESDDGSDTSSHGEAQSPSKSAGGAEANDLVANARRERKVQDLQITNASLEAINRTLERELKKQTSELRRFKRLSRSGRLSTAASNRPSTSADVGLGLSVLSEEGDSTALGTNQSTLDSDPKPESDNSLSDDYDDSDLSPSEDEADPSGEKTEHVARRHQHRLELDMSKHRQLLEDSQRMNQSLKRCLDWTEELIREGNKALAYNIRLGEVEATGHRLAFNGLAGDGEDGGGDDDEEEDDDDNDDGQDGKSDDFDGTDAMSEAQCTEEWIGEVRSELPKWGEKVAQQDRDSGVDLTPDGG